MSKQEMRRKDVARPGKTPSSGHTAPATSATSAPVQRGSRWWLPLAGGALALLVVGGLFGGGIIQILCPALIVNNGSSSNAAAAPGTLNAPAAVHAQGALGALGGPGGITWSVPTLEGGQYNFAEHAGEPMLLFLSASYCRECLDEVPKMAKLNEKYKAQGLQVVALDLDPQEAPQAWAAFRQEGGSGGAGYTWAMDNGSRVTLALNVQYMDTKIVFDRNGKELSRSFGNVDYDQLEARVQAALK